MKATYNGADVEGFDELRVRAMQAPADVPLQISAAEAALAADHKMDAVVFLTNAYRVERTPELYDRLRGLVDGHNFRMLRLPHPRASRPFTEEFGPAVRYPLQAERRWLLIGGGLAIGTARLAPAFFPILGEPLYLAFASVCFFSLALQAMRVAAGGRDDCLDWAGDDLGGYAFAMRAGGFIGFGISQMGVGLAVMTMWSGVDQLTPLFILLLTAVAGSLLATPLIPAILLVWGVSGGTTLERLNPFRWVRLAFAAPKDYALNAVVFAVAGFGFVACEAAARVVAFDSIVVVLPLSPVLGAFQIYLLLLSFRLTGLLWYHHEDRFAAIAERSMKQP